MFSFSNFQASNAPSMNQKTGEGNFRELRSKKIPGGASGGACPQAPLEACSLGPSFRRSVSIYPRSAPDDCSFIRLTRAAISRDYFESQRSPSSIFLWHNSEVTILWIVTPRGLNLLTSFIRHHFLCYLVDPWCVVLRVTEKNTIRFISPTFITASVVFRRGQQVDRCCTICWIWGSSVEETSRKNLKWHAWIKELLGQKVVLTFLIPTLTY